MNTGSRALVTGATGFLGQYVVEALRAAGTSVRAFCRQPNQELERLGVDFALGDLRDAEAVERACREVDIVYHVAGVAGIWGPWNFYYEQNTLGTDHVISACRKQGVRRLVYTSSPSVTFAGGAQCGIDESMPYPQTWLCHYPHSKALAEQHVLAANDPHGLLTCALRPHLIWGPRDRHLIPRLLERARTGKLLQVGDGNNLVDMIYVENAARAHLQAAEHLTPDSPVAGQAYFISQGEPVRCWDWINAILALAGITPVRRRVPYRLAWTVGWGLEVIYRVLGIESEPRMTRFLAAQLAKSHYFSIERARRDFGYAPIVSTEEGMRRLGAYLTHP